MDELEPPPPLPEEPPPGNSFGPPAEVTTQEETGPPTHILWREDSAELVTRGDYAEDNPNFSAIPENYDERWFRPDFETRAMAPDLDIVRAVKWEEVKVYRDQVRHGGFMSAKGVMDSDLESQAKIHAAVTMSMLMGAAFPVIAWTMADNSVVEFSGPDIQLAGLTSGIHDATCHAIGQALRDRINDPEATLEDILAIDPAEADWPE